MAHAKTSLQIPTKMTQSTFLTFLLHVTAIELMIVGKIKSTFNRKKNQSLTVCNDSDLQLIWGHQIHRSKKLFDAKFSFIKNCVLFIIIIYYLKVNGT